ncbi:MAG: helix-turn-helix domain-containing protein, partial [Puniceicoccales bacterium]
NKCFSLYKNDILLYIFLMVSLPISHFDYTLDTAYDRAVAPFYRTQTHHRGTAYVSWYLRSGSVRVESGQTHLRAHEGDWVFIDAFTTRSHRFSDDAELVSIRHRLNWRGLQFIPPRRPPTVYRGPLQKDLLHAAESLASFAHEHGEKPPQEMGSLNCLHAVRLNQWLYHWHRLRESSGPALTTVKDTRAYSIIAQMEDRRSIRPIPYARISAAIGLSKAQIDRIFKAEFEITLKQWQESQCLQAAEEFLASDAYTLKEIAAALEFFDASHFSRWFSQQSGLAPGKWKQQYRAGAA